MCIFRQEVASTPGAPAIAPRLDQDTGLPDSRPTKDDEKVASVQFGNTKKDQGSAAANRVGTDALKINLDDTTGASTGGVNTNV